jgi:hypothetical protein
MKTYTSRFSSLKAEFKSGMVAVIFDGQPRYQETLVMTFPEAKAYFPEFLKKVEPGPAQAFISCFSQRKPLGWNQMKHMLEKRD